MASNDAVRGEFYFNVATGEVEEGKVSTWVDRMGPYPTREEAAHALEKADARTTVWDGDDEAWSPDQDEWRRTEEARRRAQDVQRRSESAD